MANVRSNRIAFHLKTEANGPMPVALSQLANVGFRDQQQAGVDPDPPFDLFDSGR